MEDQIALVPMACAVGFGLPVGDLQVIPTICIYSPQEDAATIGTWLLEPFPLVAFYGGVLTIGCKSRKRLEKYKQLRSEKQKWRPPSYQEIAAFSAITTPPASRTKTVRNTSIRSLWLLYNERFLIRTENPRTNFGRFRSFCRKPAASLLVTTVNANTQL